MKSLFLAIFLSLLSNSSFANFNDTSRLLLSYRPYFVCDAKTIDSTLLGPTNVEVIREIDLNGHFIAGSTMRILTKDGAIPLRYYISHEEEPKITDDGHVYISLWRFTEGSSFNAQIGFLEWNNKSKVGKLHIEQIETIDLALSNCH